MWIEEKKMRFRIIFLTLKNLDRYLTEFLLKDPDYVDIPHDGILSILSNMAY